MTKSLAELKSEVESEETTQEPEPTEIVEEETAEVETEEEGVIDPDNEVEETESKEAAEEPESWLRSENEESEETKQVPLIAVQKVRGKLKDVKAESQAKSDEIAQLRAEIDALKSGSVQQQSEELKKPTRPRRDTFLDDGEYEAALDNYEAESQKFLLSQIDAQSRQSVDKERQNLAAKRAQEALQSQVEAHYERAAKVVQDNSISPEVYQQADTAVRQSVDQITGNGDLVVDQLIANMGEGSEKVIYALGRNSKKLDALKASLIDDPSGIKSAIMLGKLTAEYQGAKTKPVSRAKKPAPKVKGDANVSSGEAALKRKVDKAISAGDTQTALNLRKEARSKGFNTKNW